MTNSALHFSIVPDRLYRRNTFSYSQWLVRNSRVVFFSLVIANVLVGVAMIALRGETATPELVAVAEEEGGRGVGGDGSVGDEGEREE